MAPVLGYWPIRGLAQPIRFLLEYTDTKYEEKRHERGHSGWSSEKFNLGLDFPNLPYYIDGDIKLSQSTAIIRHIARKNILMGTTDQEKARVDLAECQLTDFRNAYTSSVIYGPNYDTVKPNYLKELPGKLTLFSNFLGTYPYFGGKNLSYVDFMVYDMLDQHKAFSPGCLDKFPNLEQFTKRIEALPKIPAYMRSSKFIDLPHNGPTGNFGASEKKN